MTTQTSNNIPPASVDVERAVIGSMLVDGGSIDETLVKLKDPAIFYDQRHQKIFKAIKQLTDELTGIDILTVSNQLRSNGDHGSAGGDMYLIELSQVVASSAHIEYHCAILLQQWVKRQVISMSQQQIGDSYNDTTDVFDLVEKSEKGLDQVNDMLTNGSREISFGSALTKVVNRVEMLTNNQGKNIAGVTTGFKTLDSFTGGWMAGDLVVIAARPGMGKTSMILKNVLEIALSGNPVGMFSLEMSIDQLAARLISINSNFHLTQLIKKGFEKDEYFERLVQVQHAMSSLPIYIDDAAGTTISQLAMKARLWKRKHGITALFVDYIQLMSGESSHGNREQEIATISRKLKTIAKELDIPVIALSQLSRSVETRGGDKRPRLSDLRESGAIEQDADTVVFIYRPEYYGHEPDPDMMESGANTEIMFAKYRAGSLETKGLYWQGDKTKFMDVSDVQDQPTPF